jgi:spermidine synthase
VFETPDGSRFLQNGGMTEGSNDIADLRTTQLLAALPLYSASAPKSALVIGLGTGYTSRALLDTSLERVDTVEINPAVVPAARYFIGESAEKDPRWKLHVADARNYLLQSNQRWDIVTSEPSWPLSSGVTSLFTKEFFVLSRQRLTPDGVFCQWLPRSIMSKDDFEMMYKTFASVYPNCQVWGLDGAMPDSELMLIGVNGDVRVDDASVRRQADERLTSGGLPDTSFHLFDRPEIMADALTNPSVPFNTDDRPLLQFSLARGRIQLWADAAQAR